MYLKILNCISLLKLKYKETFEFFFTTPPKPHNFCIDTPLQSNIIDSNIKVSIIKIFAAIGIPTCRAKAWKEGFIVANKALAEGDLDNHSLRCLPKDHIYEESRILFIQGRWILNLFSKKHFKYIESLTTSIYDTFCIEYNIVPRYKKPHSISGHIRGEDWKIWEVSITLAKHHFVSRFENESKFRLMR